MTHNESFGCLTIFEPGNILVMLGTMCITLSQALLFIWYSAVQAFDFKLGKCIMCSE